MNSAQISVAEILTLPAGRTLPRGGLGNNFYFIEADLPLFARSDLDDWKPFDVACGLDYGPRARSFKRIEVQNRAVEGTATFTLYRGFAKYIDQRLTVSNARRIPAPIVPAPACISSSGEVAMATAETHDIPAPPAGLQNIILVYAITAGNLNVEDADGNPVDSFAIEAGEVRTLETQQALTFIQGAGSGEYIFATLQRCEPLGGVFDLTTEDDDDLTTEDDEDLTTE